MLFQASVLKMMVNSSSVGVLEAVLQKKESNEAVFFAKLMNK